MRRSVANLLLLACLAVVPGIAHAIYASSIDGGCCIAAANDCRVHTDPIVINVAPGQSLEKLMLSLGAVVVYDWRSDVSNPPTGIYTPVLAGRDFASLCGKGHTASLTAKDSADASPVSIGQTATLTCPTPLPEPEGALLAAMAVFTLIARARLRSPS